jgi:hypothetical protein
MHGSEVAGYYTKVPTAYKGTYYHFSATRKANMLSDKVTVFQCTTSVLPIFDSALCTISFSALTQLVLSQNSKQSPVNNLGGDQSVALSSVKGACDESISSSQSQSASSFGD